MVKTYYTTRSTVPGREPEAFFRAAGCTIEGVMWLPLQLLEMSGGGCGLLWRVGHPTFRCCTTVACGEAQENSKRCFWALFVIWRDCDDKFDQKPER
jgi:hypothetical protein